MNEDSSTRSPQTVYVLIGWDQYYPPHDGTLAVFSDKDRAEEVLEEVQRASIYGEGDMDWDTLREKYDWLPGYDHEAYDIVEHELQ